MTYLTDQLAVARINRIKRRIHEAWKAAHCRCPVCEARRAGLPTPSPVEGLLRLLGGYLDEHEAAGPLSAASKH